MEDDSPLCHLNTALAPHPVSTRILNVWISPSMKELASGHSAPSPDTTPGRVSCKEIGWSKSLSTNWYLSNVPTKESIESLQYFVSVKKNDIHYHCANKYKSVMRVLMLRLLCCLSKQISSRLPRTHTSSPGLDTAHLHWAQWACLADILKIVGTTFKYQASCCVSMVSAWCCRGVSLLSYKCMHAYMHMCMEMALSYVMSYLEV